MTDVDEIFSKSQEWLKENTKRYAFKKLEREVIKTGVCVECGTCVSNCPVDAITGNRESGKYVPELTGKCISCGICYAMCPRSYTLPEHLIGHYIGIHKARSTIEGGKRQDGGVATAILESSMNHGDLDAAIVAKHVDIPWLPGSHIAKSPEDIRQSGGTVYTHSPVVAGLMEAIEEGHTKIGIVGTSCNIEGIARLESHPAGFLKLAKNVRILKIGLFCMESFDYHGLVEFLKEHGIGINDVQRMAIAGGKFTVTYGNGEKEWPIADLNPVAARSCSYCHDLTCKHSDISCGNIGSEEGWTTVIVRTEKGKKAFDKAASTGIIDYEELDSKAIQTILNVSRSKAIRYYKMEPAH